MITTPSSSARAISSGEAGMMSRLSRQAIVTFFAPRRLAVIATSMATLPPPVTITSEPILPFIQSLTSTRKSRPK